MMDITREWWLFMWCLPCQYKSKIPPRPISTVIERYKTFWTLRNNEDLQRSQNKSSMTFVQNPPAQLKTKLCTWPFAPPINSATTVKKHAELTRWRDKTSHPFTTCDTLVTGMPLWYLSCSYRMMMLQKDRAANAGCFGLNWFHVIFLSDAVCALWEHSM